MGKVIYYVKDDSSNKLERIGDKREFYNFVAFIVRFKRLFDPSFLYNKCVFDLPVHQLITILNVIGFEVVYFNEEDHNE